uniref:Uncharacterized protein n=1 Tax=Hucho hucho TaxID=62062 RepID=A0A4W5LCZ6_9TELE
MENSSMKAPSQTHPQSKDQYTSVGVAARTQTPSQYIIHITAEDANAHMASRENSEAVSALLASQNPSEPSYLSEPSRHLVLNPSVAPPSPLRKSPSECNLRNQTPSVSECDLTNQTPSVSECNLRNQTPSVSECNLRNQTPSVSECNLRNQTPSVSECNLRNQTPSVSECRKPKIKRQQHIAGSLGSKIELVHSVVLRPSVSESAAVVEREKVQQQPYFSMLPCIKNALLADEARKSYKLSPSPDVPKPLPSPDIKSKTQSVLETGSKPKPLTSPEVSKHKVRYPDNPPRSSFKPVLTRGTESPGSCTKSPLIIDKNEHFTVYRDPALVRPEQESNHVSYLHPQLHPLHASSHASRLTPSSTHHHTSHLLPSSHSHHLSGVLSGLPQGPLLGDHPRLDSSGLGYLGLAHHHPVSQPQTHSHTSASYSQLGLYPVIWQYPNGTRSYPPGLNLPGSKWVHPENT